MNLPIKIISNELKANIPEMDFAFLFGSFADGTQTVDSDIDIGVYLNTEISLGLISKIIACVENIVRIKCDVSVLNTASEILRFEALKGKLLFVRKEKIEAYVNFYSLTCREYEDKIAWMKKQLKLRELA